MHTSQSLGTLCFASMLAACAATPPPPVTVMTPAPVASVQPVAPPVAPAQESLTINFSDGNATLSEVATTQLDGAARLYRNAQPEVMIISGHSDKVGREFENVILSARRAAAVKHGLVDRGLPPDRLQIIAVGVAEPVPGIPASRTAVVTWR